MPFTILRRPAAPALPLRLPLRLAIRGEPTEALSDRSLRDERAVLNIALVILHADPARGGAERYTIDLAEALARSGHAVTLIAASFAADDKAGDGGMANGLAAANGAAATRGASSAQGAVAANAAAATRDAAFADVQAAGGETPGGGITDGQGYSDRAAGASNPIARVTLSAAGLTRLNQYGAFLDSLDRHLADNAAGPAANRYDIVHAMLPVRSCDIYHPHAGLAAEAMAAGHRKRVHALAARLSQLGNHLNLKRRRFVAVERELLDRKDPPILLCLSDYLKKTVAEHYALADSAMRTLFNAVDLNRFDPQSDPEAGLRLRRRLGIGADRVVALMIAQDYFRKGLRQAILATAKIADGRAAAGKFNIVKAMAGQSMANQAGADPTAADRLTLLVVGKQDPAEYRHLAADRGVGDRVIFVGPTDSPADFYKAADFFVLPTRHDPCSLVVLESLAMGVPVISTIFNGACQIMRPAEHGYVLQDPADVDALAEAMRQLLDDSRRAEMRRQCLLLRPGLSFQAHVNRLEEIYRSRLSRPAESR
jgi:UDP-glucose:(heptosyl)LPS alpha-1,3-glucosyltransferase